MTKWVLVLCLFVLVGCLDQLQAKRERLDKLLSRRLDYKIAIDRGKKATHSLYGSTKTKVLEMVEDACWEAWGVKPFPEAYYGKKTCLVDHLLCSQNSTPLECFQGKIEYNQKKLAKLEDRISQLISEIAKEEQ